jgi:integrase/recombinase XerD
MTALAPSLAVFLREHLPRDRRASPHTCEAYAYSFQLLVTFAARRLGTKPSQLEVEQLDVPMILAFLEHIEQERGNTARSRNARLAAIKSFFRFLEYRLPPLSRPGPASARDPDEEDSTRGWSPRCPGSRSRP